MNRAQRRAATLRRKLGLHGQIDAEAVANSLGLTVRRWPLEVQLEFADGEIVVAERLDAEWRRWMTAHAIGHHLLHPGNHLLVHEHTRLKAPYERQADDFARTLLVDDVEALDKGFVHSWEVAEHFGVPDELVRLQGRLLPPAEDWYGTT